MKASHFILYLLVSFCVVGAAQPDWGVWGNIGTSCIGYALFWRGMTFFSRRKERFWCALLWFALIEGIHLNWFLADRYVGGYIYPFLSLLCLALGAQFAFLSLCIPLKGTLGVRELLGISAGWTLLEWSRLFFLTGFSWDPVGLALTGTNLSMQCVAIGGVYGLTFWVFLTNLAALRALSTLHRSAWLLWTLLALTPYAFGLLHLGFHSARMRTDEQQLSVLLVQTSLAPNQKIPIDGSIPLSPDVQWERILQLLAPYRHRAIDLIVLSEGVVPYGIDFPIYLPHLVEASLKRLFADIEEGAIVSQQRLGNRFWAQSMAHVMQAPVVIGLEDYGRESYNAAFVFHPEASPATRYEKRVLVPFSEYIPFAWCKRFLIPYGIYDSLTPGKEAKVLPMGSVQAGISICYEETYGNLIIDNRRKGAEVLINLSNDAWYPHSRLPIIHMMHGRLRAVEGGIPLLRSCNTGVTCGIDALGRVVQQLPYDCRKHPAEPGVLYLQLPRYQYKTLYTAFGDKPVISISCLLFAAFVFLPIKRRFGINRLNASFLPEN